VNSETATAYRPPPTWRELQPDDDPAIEALQFAGWAAATPARKLLLLRDLTRFARRLSLVGIQRRHPDASPAELAELLAASWKVDDELGGAGTLPARRAL
jgi:hypothetical protein